MGTWLPTAMAKRVTIEGKPALLSAGQALTDSAPPGQLSITAIQMRVEGQ